MPLVGNVPSQNIELAEVQSHKEGRGMIICPYCNSTFESKDEITRHIDETHIFNS